jgi:hypothetical protein
MGKANRFSWNIFCRHLFTPSSKDATSLTTLCFYRPALTADYKELMTVAFFENVELASTIVTSFYHFVLLSKNDVSLTQLGLVINLLF